MDIMTMVRSKVTVRGDTMRTIPAGEVKTKCLAILDEVNSIGVCRTIW
jgi:hypothetical protein